MSLSAHVLVVPGGDCHTVRARLETVLREEYGITHTTLQADHAPSSRDPLPAPQGHCLTSHGPVHRAAAPEPARVPGA